MIALTTPLANRIYLRKIKIKTIRLTLFNFALGLSLQSQSTAQIIVDRGNIAVPTQVEISKNEYRFTQGTKRGENIFHSFKQFNIRSNKSVIFQDENKNIKNLVIRVTGGNISKLNGIFDSGGIDNLIFLNPSGFKINSGFKTKNIKSLNITTANSIYFSDNFILNSSSYIHSSDTLSDIEKFSFIRNSGIIDVRNSGDILESNILEIPANLSRAKSTIEVNKQGRIFLSGNRIFGNGALLYAPEGDIYLHSKEYGDINYHKPLKSNELQGEIILDNYSVIETGGEEHGSINLVSKDIQITNGSSLLSNNTKNSDGNIVIKANNLLLEGITEIENISSVNLDNPLLSPLRSRSTITVVNKSDLTSSRIKIKANKVQVINGGRIANVQGNIYINSNQIDLINGDNVNPKTENNILAGTFSDFDADDIDITSQKLNIRGGSNIISTTFNSGKAGNLNISVDEINIGSDSPGSASNFISSASFSTGNSGDVNINSKKIYINNNGVIGNSSIGSSDTGDVNINSAEVRIVGKNVNSRRTAIASTVFPDAINFGEAERFRIASLNDFRGRSGNINLNTDNLFLESSLINTENLGLGEGGTININASRFFADRSEITLTTNNGNAGTLNIISDSVILSSSILTSKTNTLGIGGGINIDADYFATAGETSIVADSNRDQAGKISIISKAANLSPKTNLSAESGLGNQFNGSIDLNIQNQVTQPRQEIIPALSPTISFSDACRTSRNSITRAPRTLTQEIINDPELITAVNPKKNEVAAETLKFRDSTTGKVHSFKRWLAVEKLDENKARFIYSSKQSDKLKNMIFSLESKCGNLSS